RVVYIQRLKLMLSVKTFFYIMPPFALAFKRFNACNNAQQRRLSLAVCTDQRDLIAAVDLGGSFVYNMDVAKMFIDVLQSNQHPPRYLINLEIYFDIRSFNFHIFYAIQLIKSFHGTLR